MSTPPESPEAQPAAAGRQLSLTLPLPAAFDADDLVRGACNMQALTLLESWPDWLHPIVYLSGPPASGKSHIGSVWAARAGAVKETAAALNTAWVAEAKARPIFIDDLFSSPPDEAALFHLINRQIETGQSLVLATRLPLEMAPVSIDDLRSRLRAALAVTIDPPDDAMLEAVIIKLLSDRQLEAAPAAIRYALTRMDRSFEAATRLVRRIDEITLEEKRRVTTPVVVKALSQLT